MGVKHCCASRVSGNHKWWCLGRCSVLWQFLKMVQLYVPMTRVTVRGAPAAKGSPLSAPVKSQWTVQLLEAPFENMARISALHTLPFFVLLGLSSCYCNSCWWNETIKKWCYFLNTEMNSHHIYSYGVKLGQRLKVRQWHLMLLH